jgi:hypothetical protein
MAKKDVQLTHLIGYTLSKLRTYEWVKFNMFAKENIYLSTPGLYFRFHSPGQVYNQLAECVASFQQGELQWKLYLSFESRNQNYSLEPYEVFLARSTDEFKEHYDLKRILGERYNKICELGMKDIPALNDHIEKWFQVEDKMPILPDQD